jgi:hypothetical protein
MAVLLAHQSCSSPPQVCHEAWQAARTPWYTVVCLLLLLVTVVGVVMEVQAVRRGAWTQLPGHDGAGAVQMRAVGGGAAARQAEAAPLLHSLHTLE